jgi:hypothetical protein
MVDFYTLLPCGRNRIVHTPIVSSSAVLMTSICQYPQDHDVVGIQRISERGIKG